MKQTFAIASFFLLIVVFSCNNEEIVTPNVTPDTNKPPVANAGVDLNVVSTTYLGKAMIFWM